MLLTLYDLLVFISHVPGCEVMVEVTSLPHLPPCSAPSALSALLCCLERSLMEVAVGSTQLTARSPRQFQVLFDRTNHPINKRQVRNSGESGVFVFLSLYLFIVFVRVYLTKGRRSAHFQVSIYLIYTVMSIPSHSHIPKHHCNAMQYP